MADQWADAVMDLVEAENRRTEEMIRQGRSQLGATIPEIPSVNPMAQLFKIADGLT